MCTGVAAVVVVVAVEVPLVAGMWRAVGLVARVLVGVVPVVIVAWSWTFVVVVVVVAVAWPWPWPWPWTWTWTWTFPSSPG